MRYIVSVIPHAHQPYNTVADWRFDAEHKICFINVSNTGNEIFNNALALHEETEIMLLLQRMSSYDSVLVVDKFDKSFERRRKDSFESEPGDDPHAPYHVEHGFATAVERMYIAASGENWKRYEDKLVAMMKKYPKIKR